MKHRGLIFVKPFGLSWSLKHESFSEKAELKVGLLGKSRQGREFRQDFSGHIALKNALKVGLFHLNRLALIYSYHYIGERVKCPASFVNAHKIPVQIVVHHHLVRINIYIYDFFNNL